MRLTKAERAVFKKMGSKGGKKRAEAMTQKERSAACRLAVTARWAQTKPKTKPKKAALAKTA